MRLRWALVAWPTLPPVHLCLRPVYNTTSPQQIKRESGKHSPRQLHVATQYHPCRLPSTTFVGHPFTSCPFMPPACCMLQGPSRPPRAHLPPALCPPRRSGCLGGWAAAVTCPTRWAASGEAPPRRERDILWAWGGNKRQTRPARPAGVIAILAGVRMATCPPAACRLDDLWAMDLEGPAKGQWRRIQVGIVWGAFGCCNFRNANQNRKYNTHRTGTGCVAYMCE